MNNKSNRFRLRNGMLLSMAVLLMGGCGIGADTKAAEEKEAVETSVAGWKITVEDCKISDSFENISVELGYTGVETSDFEKKAEDGKTFCLLKLIMKKDGSKEKVEWENLKITDAEENEYVRIEDDFLTELGMKRMTGNALNFGTNEGWVAFEIDENAEDLVLSYPFEAEEYRFELEQNEEEPAE